MLCTVVSQIGCIRAYVRLVLVVIRWGLSGASSRRQYRLGQ